MTKGQSFISLLSKYLPRLISILLGAVLGLMTAKIYFLLSRNLILENYLLECEINDYIATKLAVKNDELIKDIQEWHEKTEGEFAPSQLPAAYLKRRGFTEDYMRGMK